MKTFKFLMFLGGILFPFVVAAVSLFKGVPIGAPLEWVLIFGFVGYGTIAWYDL